MNQILTREDLKRAEQESFYEIQRAVFDSKFKGKFRGDANETPFLERQYVQLRSRIFAVEFAPTLARTFAPIAADIDPFTDVYSYEVTEEVGNAKVGTYAGNDVPRADTNAKEVFGKVIPIVGAFAWNIGEMGQAARLNIDLSGRKMQACRNMIERGLDKVIAFGSIPDETGALPALGLGGLVNNAAVVTQGVASLSAWSTGTSPSTIMAELSSLVATINNNTNGAYTADTILLPTKDYNYIQQTPFSTLSGESILSVFRRNNPNITLVAPWWRLNTAGASGVPRAIAYQRSSEVLEIVMPLDFTTLPPEAQTFEMVYNCHARCGGVNIYRPFAMGYGDFAGTG